MLRQAAYCYCGERPTLFGAPAQVGFVMNGAAGRTIPHDLCAVANAGHDDD
jgi:hypothetical protein